jgi:hypothetical protein
MARRWLVFVLRFGASVMALALLAVVMPTEWMQASNARLGLTPLAEQADTPLFQYLTRSLALLYAVHGGLLWLASTDIDRLRPLVRYMGASAVFFGVVVLGIDLAAGMPWYWTAAEAGGVTANGLVVLWLDSRVERNPAS